MSPLGSDFELGEQTTPCCDDPSVGASTLRKKCSIMRKIISHLLPLDGWAACVWFGWDESGRCKEGTDL